jgi:hypothetical protein
VADAARRRKREEGERRNASGKHGKDWRAGFVFSVSPLAFFPLATRGHVATFGDPMSEDRDNIEGAACRSGRRWLVGIVVTFVLLAAGVFVAGLLQPPRYFAKVTMEVKREGAPAGYDPEFVAEQFQTMRRPEILYPVIERLDLHKAFAKGTEPLPLAEVHRLLLDSLSVREVRDTGLIEVGVYSSSPQLAANIANTIAIVFQEKLIQGAREPVMRSLARLEEEVRKRHKVVEELAAELAKIRDREGIFDPDPESVAAPITAPTGQASRTAYSEAKSRYIEGRKLLEASQAVVNPGRHFIADRSIKIWEKAEPPLEPARLW